MIDDILLGSSIQEIFSCMNANREPLRIYCHDSQSLRSEDNERNFTYLYYLSDTLIFLVEAKLLSPIYQDYFHCNTISEVQAHYLHFEKTQGSGHYRILVLLPCVRPDIIIDLSPIDQESIMLSSAFFILEKTALRGGFSCVQGV